MRVNARVLPIVFVLLSLSLTVRPLDDRWSAKAMVDIQSTEHPQVKTLESESRATNNGQQSEKETSRGTVSDIHKLPSGWPVQGCITSRFGTRRIGRHTEFHPGLDIAVPIGTEVFATADGEVVFAARQSGYGNLVVIDHGNGVTTRYGHLSKISVTSGQQMNRGNAIGLSGSTGRSTGTHVHYEVRENGAPTNPMKWSGRLKPMQSTFGFRFVRRVGDAGMLLVRA